VVSYLTFNSGTKKIKYLEENVAAFNVHLSTSEVHEMRKDIEKVEIFGDRYAPLFQKYSFGDTPEL